MSDFYSDLEDGELFSICDDYAEDLKYRSIAVEARPTFGPSREYYAPAPAPAFTFVSKTAKTSSASFTSGCPSIPYGVAKTNFGIDKTDYASVVRSIEENLLRQINFDFSYWETDFMWKGKYLSGANCFEVEINLYQDQSTRTFTVAVRRTSGDCSASGAFNNFYNAMRSALSTDTTPAAPVRKPFCIPKCSVAVSDEEFVQGVQPIFTMGASGSCLESRIQSAKMLCDVSQKEARYLELSAFRPACVELLEALVTDESEDVRQYAVMAVASFAELASYKEAFLQSCVLPVLFSLVENCSEVQQVYETAQVRRTAATVLAVLSRTHPYSVRSELQRQQCDVAGWLQRVSCLQDGRTRDSALVVKAFLEEVSVVDSLESLIIGSACSGGFDCIFVQD